MGANVDAGLNHLPSGESDGQLDVEGRSKCVVAVDKGLVQIENDSFSTFVM